MNLLTDWIGRNQKSVKNEVCNKLKYSGDQKPLKKRGVTEKPYE